MNCIDRQSRLLGNAERHTCNSAEVWKRWPDVIRVPNEVERRQRVQYYVGGGIELSDWLILVTGVPSFTVH